MTESPSLAWRIGRLIRIEREKREWTQAGLARRAGIDQSALSRLERGRSGVTTTLIERVLAALGYQLAIDIEALDAELDTAIANHSTLSTTDREAIPGRFLLPLSRLASTDLDYRLGGTFGAFLHGVPVEVAALDLAIAATGADGFAAWLRMIPSALRWNARHRDFTDDSKDPREPGAARWGTPGGEIRAVVMDALPEPVVIRLGDVDYPVLPLPSIVALDPQVARVVDRIDQTTRAAAS